jgi:hypothetical protein
MEQYRPTFKVGRGKREHATDLRMEQVKQHVIDAGILIKSGFVIY